MLVLAQGGYGVLAVDHRGHGQRGGTPMDPGWSGDADVCDLVFDRNPMWSERMGVLGIAMGGEEGLTAAASD
jgi:alpha-beta hydrolase superfamily lysophospholipase